MLPENRRRLENMIRGEGLGEIFRTLAEILSEKANKSEGSPAHEFRFKARICDDALSALDLEGVV